MSSADCFVLVCIKDNNRVRTNKVTLLTAQHDRNRIASYNLIYFILSVIYYDKRSRSKIKMSNNIQVSYNLSRANLEVW